MDASLSFDPTSLRSLPPHARVTLFRYLSSRFAACTALTLLRAALSWHLYEITGSMLLLGTLGLAQFVPTFFCTVAGGLIADRFERTRVVRIAQWFVALTGVAVVLVTQWGSLTTPVVFAAAGWAAAWGGIEQPSRASLLVSLVPRAALPKAVTVAATLQSLAFASGPVLAGGLLALGNPWIAYLTHAALMLLSALLLRTLPPCHPPPVEDRPGVFSQMVEGAQFVKQRPAVWGCMTLDMVAVIFGGATALLPVYAKDVLDAGPAGYGILAASLELGALATSLLLTMRRPIVSAGRALLVTVAVFGLATMAFGASTSLPLSMAALFVVGASDQVSVVLRHTIVQLATPDALRGRVSAINMLFVHASNQLGAFESGALAAATSAPFSVVFGGFAAVVTAVTMAGLNRELHRYRVDHTNEAA